MVTLTTSTVLSNQYNNTALLFNFVDLFYRINIYLFYQINLGMRPIKVISVLSCPLYTIPCDMVELAVVLVGCVETRHWPLSLTQYVTI